MNKLKRISLWFEDVQSFDYLINYAALRKLPLREVERKVDFRVFLETNKEILVKCVYFKSIFALNIS